MYIAKNQVFLPKPKKSFFLKLSKYFRLLFPNKPMYHEHIEKTTGAKQMNFNNTFAAILTIALTAGLNISAMANVPTEQENQKENNNPITETTQPQWCFPGRC
ncbi:hypothetical protein cce_0321 [Crocosphaera subtropica ATCC 51142]|uniref:Uncharacterized protein n=1 Tax=Crocosphaera subtropica (strain ATCC 51142 / BH68) TaxID=43989 RepID=B1X131_CROS5|nr:hypothetical protein [Crocosphaera subtropica]ACB49672.1 hypothetical protein cce_0321 [Crocosphaera subtropica ATCC 51142]